AASARRSKEACAAAAAAGCSCAKSDRETAIPRKKEMILDFMTQLKQILAGDIRFALQFPNVPVPLLALPIDGSGGSARRSRSRRILQGPGPGGRAGAGVDPELARCARAAQPVGGAGALP